MTPGRFIVYLCKVAAVSAPSGRADAVLYSVVGYAAHDPNSRIERASRKPMRPVPDDQLIAQAAPVGYPCRLDIDGEEERLVGVFEGEVLGIEDCEQQLEATPPGLVDRVVRAVLGRIRP